MDESVILQMILWGILVDCLAASNADQGHSYMCLLFMFEAKTSIRTSLVIDSQNVKLFLKGCLGLSFPDLTGSLDLKTMSSLKVGLCQKHNTVV